jgi:hypothetical protein
MFENLVNLFNQQSTFIQVVVVAIVAYIIYLVYLELTKEKFSQAVDVSVCNSQQLSNINSRNESIRSKYFTKTANYKEDKSRVGKPNYIYHFKDSSSLQTLQNVNFEKDKKYVIESATKQIICRL